ncbi:MAG: nucleotide pyrophosphohydrolase [Sphingobacteriia bacterium]|nr:nucleotide pyrophosphohydrolase [Sphingobacteriia bacterium]
MNEFNELTEILIKFRNDRDWEQFHNPKDLAIALSVEAGELLELFLWKDADQADITKIREELADVLAYSLLLADKYKLDISEIVKEKVKKNEVKYPVDKAWGNAKKYTEL